MKLVFETERLLLREFCLEDAQFFYDLNADEEVLKHTGDVAFSSVESARIFLEAYKEYEKNGFGRWLVLKKENNLPIGWCGLKRNEEGMIDLGFRFVREEWNKGYATEAARASLQYGFLDLRMNEIIGRTAIDNKGSIKVLEKIGMRFWKHYYFEGIDSAFYYSITKNEFLTTV